MVIEPGVSQQMNKTYFSATIISYFLSSSFIIVTKTFQGSKKLENLKKANVFWEINDKVKWLICDEVSFI